MKVLAIETSCDETAAAVLERTDGADSIRLLANVVYSQMDLHQAYGGVYPELASREHVAKILPVIEEALKKTIAPSPDTQHLSPKLDLAKYLKDEIDLIAVTAGPGLIGSLLVGVNAAKTLAYALDKPIMPIHHHEGHIAAAWIQATPDTQHLTPKLPALALVVSGGHTQLVLVRQAGQFEIIGKTRDDAAGEAFDKVARLLGLGYPGGPAIATLANTYHPTPTAQHLHLPRPMIDSLDLDFSFSGIKTAVAQLIAAQTELTDIIRAEIAHEFQEAVVEVLIHKTKRALEMHQPRSLILAGGVAANTRLREEFTSLGHDQLSVHIPPFAYCTDNAAMIGAAALLRSHNNQTDTWQQIHANDRLQLGAKE